MTSAFPEGQTKQAQWQGFIRKSHLEAAPGKLEDVIEAIATFRQPITEALTAEKEFEGTWVAPGPWESHDEVI